MRRILSIAAGLFIALAGAAFAADDSYTKIPLWGGDVQVAALSPSDPDVLYVGSAYNGTYVTRDGGASWTSNKFVGSYGNSGVQTLCVHPTAPGTCLAGTWGAGSNYVMRTTDYGQSWTNVTSSIENLTMGRIIASKKTAGTFYLMGTESSGSTVVVYRSTDGGATWGGRTVVAAGKAGKDMAADDDDNLFVTLASSFNIMDSDQTGALCKGTVGGSFAQVAAYTMRVDSVLISSRTVMVNEDMNNSGSDSGAYVSTDTGVSFLHVPDAGQKSGRFLSADGSSLYSFSSLTLQVSTAPLFDTYTAVSSSTPLSYTSNGARGAMLIPVPQDPSLFFMTNSEMGVVKSTDAGATWQPANTGMGGVMALDGCKDPDGNMYVIGNLTLYKGTNGGQTWSKIYCPDELFGLAPRVGGIVAAPTGSIVLYAARADLYRSADGGATWPAQAVRSFGPDDVFTDIVINRTDPSICYFAVSSGAVQSQTSGRFIYKSTDTGETWTALPLTGSSVQALAIDQSNPSVLYAGVGDMPPFLSGASGVTNYGGIWKITDDGVNTPAWASAGLTGYLPYHIAVDTGGVVFAACLKSGDSRQHLMYSTDGGTTWQERTLPNDTAIDHISDIAYSQGLYYMATPQTIYATPSLGQSLSKVADSTTLGTIRCLVVGSMYGGADSGLYRLSPVISPLGTGTGAKVYNFPNPFNPKTGGTMTIRYTAAAAPNKVTVRIYTLAGELVAEHEDTAKSGTVTWDGRNDGGALCAPGLYFVVVDLDGTKARNKVVLVY